jgi:hypothetical protein
MKSKNNFPLMVACSSYVDDSIRKDALSIGFDIVL